MRISLVFILLACFTTFVGCSISKSSESISDSISSPSKSSSESSSGDDDAEEQPQDEESYKDDVAQLAATYAVTGGDIGALRSAVSELALARGLSNWEADPATNQAIGRGVAEGGMDPDRFAKFANDLFGDDLAKQAELRNGFQVATSSGK